MKAPTKLTHHAVERFIERYAPGMRHAEAVQRLHAIRCLATHVEDIPGEDQEIWAGTEPGSGHEILLVVHDGTVRTVLPLGSKKPAWR